MPIILLALFASSVRAMEAMYSEVAEYAGVPARILYAMSQTESGVYKSGQMAPWPWTLNIAGKPRRYDDRESMFKGLMAALSEGTLKIDVGPMQVNWYWQFDRIGSPWRITDPMVNVKVAAEILKQHHKMSGDWWEAVGLYHRPAGRAIDKKIAEKYRLRVRHFVDQAAAASGDVNAD